MKLPDKCFKVVTVKMLKEARVNSLEISKKMENLSKEIEKIKQNQIKTLRIK